MNQKYVIYIALILAGVVLADKIRALPVLGKLPTI